jgi:hypothetical protein
LFYLPDRIYRSLFVRLRLEQIMSNQVLNLNTASASGAVGVARRTLPSLTLLKGKPWVGPAGTDISKTFAAIGWIPPSKVDQLTPEQKLAQAGDLVEELLMRMSAQGAYYRVPAEDMEFFHQELAALFDGLPSLPLSSRRALTSIAGGLDPRTAVDASASVEQQTAKQFAFPTPSTQALQAYPKGDVASWYLPAPIDLGAVRG